MAIRAPDGANKTLELKFPDRRRLFTPPPSLSLRAIFLATSRLTFLRACVFPHSRAVLILKNNREYDAGTDAGADGFQMLEGKLLLQKITLLCLSCSQIFRRTNYVILDFPCNWISCKWNSI